MNIKYIMIHCSDTPNEREHSAADIHRWHQEKSFDGIGYHYVVNRAGQIEKGRPEYWEGAHEQTVNRHSLGICLIGRDQFTEHQWDSLHNLLHHMKSKYPNAQIVGHYEFDSDKTCPNFDVRKWVDREMPGVKNR